MLKSNLYSNLHSILFAIITFIFSILVSPFYTGGDQINYISFYEIIKDINFFEGYILYYSYLGAQEPFYYLLIFIFSRIADKFFIMSIINSLMAFFISKQLIVLKVNKFIIYSLLLNYYFVVLLFSAERLKFSITLLFMLFSTKGKIKSYTIQILTILSHIQSLILFFVIKVVLFFRKSEHTYRNKKTKKIIFQILILSVTIFTFYFLKDYVASKISIYIINSNFDNLIKPFIFLICSLFLTQKKLEVFLAFIPIFFFSYLLGDERINIFSFFIFFFFASRVNKGLNFIFIIVLSYYVYKGIEFTYNIFEYNTGFI